MKTNLELIEFVRGNVGTLRTYARGDANSSMKSEAAFLRAIEALRELERRLSA